MSKIQDLFDVPPSSNEEDIFIDVWTDGSSSGTVSDGGWGAVVICNGVVTEYSNGDVMTTNNRMEIQGVCEMLEMLPEKGFIRVHSDSAYLINPVNYGWIRKWRKNGWLTHDFKPVENRDLWLRLSEGIRRHYRVDFIKVKGHSGLEYNELADQLAKRARWKITNARDEEAV